MSTDIKTTVVKEPVGRYLILGINEKTQAPHMVSLVAYAPDPEDSEATLVVTESGYLVFQEIRVKAPFADFDMCVEAASHLSLSDVEREPAVISRQSPLGQAVVNYKANIANMLHQPVPGVFH